MYMDEINQEVENYIEARQDGFNIGKLRNTRKS